MYKIQMLSININQNSVSIVNELCKGKDCIYLNVRCIVSMHCVDILLVDEHGKEPL